VEDRQIDIQGGYPAAGYSYGGPLGTQKNWGKSLGGLGYMGRKRANNNDVIGGEPM